MNAGNIGLWLGFGMTAAGSGPVLEFLEPAPGSVYLAGAEVPVVLRIEVPGEIASSAEVFVDGVSVGVAVYCCRFCPCPAPSEGLALVLQLPSLVDDFPTGPPWRGLTGLTPGSHRLTARAVAGLGTEVSAAELVVTVLPITPDELQLSAAEGLTGTLEFVLPSGSLVPGGFAMWLSHDLIRWSRLDDFQPGNVAAFFSDVPDPMDRRPRFYRAIRNGD